MQGLANEGENDALYGSDVSDYPSCTILITDANPLLKDIHGRMPVMIAKDDYDLWLDRGVTDPAKVADLMRLYPVSSTVGNVKNSVDDPPANPSILIL
jgi:putative SOS response-associated peptidase YedK